MAAKKRKFQDDYLQFGFVSICIGTVEKPQCVIFQKVLGPDSMIICTNLGRGECKKMVLKKGE